MQSDMAPLTLPQTPCVRVWVARAMSDDVGGMRTPLQAAQQRHVSRALLSRALMTDWDITPHQWRLTYTPAGAPMLELAGTGHALQCCVSHADGAALCAVGSAAALGVDLERVRRDDGQDRLACHVCSAHELTQLAAYRRAGTRAARLLGLWTHKEAGAKALGAGALASVSLPRLSFDLGRSGALSDDAVAALSAQRRGTPVRLHRFAVGVRHGAALSWQPARCHRFDPCTSP